MCKLDVSELGVWIYQTENKEVFISNTGKHEKEDGPHTLH